MKMALPTDVRVALFDAVDRAVACIGPGGDLDQCRYWTGYAMGLAAAVGRPVDPFPRETVEMSLAVQGAVPGDVVTCIAGNHALHYLTPVRRLDAIFHSGVLSGFFDGTVNDPDATECGWCGNRILADDPDAGYVDCHTNGPTHLLCHQERCQTASCRREWALS